MGVRTSVVFLGTLSIPARTPGEFRGDPVRVATSNPGSSLARRAIRWCAQYFLFHRFTLHYRPRYASKECNFCQLAALHFFLEHDMVFTMPRKSGDAYKDAFMKRDEDRKALHFLMRGNDGLAGDLPFAAALGLVSREYDSIEISNSRSLKSLPPRTQKSSR